MRAAATLHSQDDDFTQPGELYRNVLSETDREHLVTNIVGHASDRRRARDASDGWPSTGARWTPTSAPGSRRVSAADPVAGP